jgi:putative hydrolase of the HAD superfamily
MLVLDRTGGIPEGVTAESLSDFYNLAEQLFLHQAPPFLLNPAAGAEIATLRSRGITTSILSNTAFMKGRSLQKLLHQLQLTDCFDFMLFSDDINCSKPGIAAFELLHQKAAALHNGRLTSPAQITHLGDDALTDVHGAVNAGMKGVLYTPPQSFVELIEKN